MDEQSYYMAQREDEYDPEAAPYEPLAPDLAGKSPLASWRNTEAKPTRYGARLNRTPVCSFARPV
jgi:hypothetical protein